MIPEVKIYVGRFSEEKYLCDMSETDYLPSKNDLIFYNCEVYKVLYVMHDMDDGVFNVFVRLAVEEDY